MGIPCYVQVSVLAATKMPQRETVCKLSIRIQKLEHHFQTATMDATSGRKIGAIASALLPLVLTIDIIYVSNIHPFILSRDL